MTGVIDTRPQESAMGLLDRITGTRRTTGAAGTTRAARGRRSTVGTPTGGTSGAGLLGRLTSGLRRRRTP